MSAGCQSVTYQKFMIYDINDEEKKNHIVENRYLRELLPKDLDLVKNLIEYI